MASRGGRVRSTSAGSESAPPDPGDAVAVVVVTHSKEMMKVADRIVVLDDGCVVEEGGYDELVARRGPFARLVEEGGWSILRRNGV
ncbi:hypothetical protein VTK73DRAFT_5307 [Phialemonium thermophilum]|uniref:Uncharacterized protein n=1 Tax=Phialemonium thermophilum TaxID=223376 RepID=A0ABR3V225_9PEZI